MYHSAICLLAALYHESGRPSVAAGNTLAHTVGQARPFTEFAELDVEARMGRVLTAKTMMERFSFESIDGGPAQSADLSRQPGGGLIAANPAAVEAVAQAIHECERPAIERGWVVVKLNPPRPWIPFGELPAPAQEGRRGQARYLLERVRIRGTTPGTKDRASAATSAARTTAPSAAGRRTAEDFARASLREESIADPSIPLLRARLMLDHAREARDLAHGWPSMLGIDTIGLASFDAAEGVARNSYRQLLNIERADGDRLAASASPAELVVLLRRAQAERDEVVTQNLKLESRLTIAEVAIHTAQEENRAPIWPPACDASPPPSN